MTGRTSDMESLAQIIARVSEYNEGEAMNDDDRNRQLARGAIAVQNVQLLLIVGLVLGFIGGAILGAYVLLPLGGLGIWLAIFAPFIGAIVGSRVILVLLAR